MLVLKGTIDIIGNNVYVKYSTTFDSEPTRQTLWWKIDTVRAHPWSAARGWPEKGDDVTSESGTEGWRAAGYTVHFPGDRQAEKVEREPVACPKTRGKETRWCNGRWEKLLAKGWVPA
jgi:hypothetical protein